MLEPDSIAPERIRPLRRSEYDKLVELGVFEDERVELLHGMLVEMSPQGAAHAALVARLHRLLLRALGDRAVVRSHSPFAASDDSEPEPDIAVVPPGEYLRRHPAKAFLLAEVADSSVQKDRVVKANVYAAARVPEYWILDLAARVIEVRTVPRRGKYTKLIERRRGDTLRLTAFPDVEIRVADLLP